MRLTLWNLPVVLASLGVLFNGTCAAENAKAPEIQLIHMGGSDCPPCVAWRALELPKLQQTEVWSSIKFSYVTKTIKSPVPPAVFLPLEVKPLKDQLDVASAGSGGSPQAALVVNGDVYAYWFGTKTAEEVEKMLIAVRDNKPFPIKPCKRWNDKFKSCAEFGDRIRR